MAKEIENPFFNSDVWNKCRAAYKKKAGGLCERCLKKGVHTPGIIVHHKIHISPHTALDPDTLTDFDNLELLCRFCYAQERNKDKQRYVIDEFGRVSTTPPS